MLQDLSYLSQNKIFAHLDRVSEWLNKGITKPIMVEIDPTNICNHNCPKCAGNKFAPQVFLSLIFMKKVIDEMSPFLKSIVFTGGGEPLCNKETIKAVSYAKQKKLDIGFITNGTLIEKNSAKILLENCTWIRVSLDAENSEDYSKIHGIDKSLYNRTLNNIELMVELKKKINSNCTIGIGYLTNKKSQNKMFLFAKKMKKLGVDYVQFRPFHFDNTDVSEEIQKCKSLEDLNFKIVVSQHRYDKIDYDYPQAYRDEFTTVIAADGKLYPCCFTRGREEFSLGNLNEDSFENIWNSKRKKEIFENKLKMKNCPIMCKYDKLSQVLWEMKKIKEEGKHINFV